MVKTVTRATLAGSVRREVGLSRIESERFVEAAIGEIADALAADGTVKIPDFGSFVVRARAARPGRNPNTGEPVTIAARRVAVFRPSRMLKARVNGRRGETNGETCG